MTAHPIQTRLLQAAEDTAAAYDQPLDQLGILPADEALLREAAARTSALEKTLTLLLVMLDRERYQRVHTFVDRATVEDARLVLGRAN